MDLSDIGVEDMDLLALAMEYLLCNGSLDDPQKANVERMFYQLDWLADEERLSSPPLVEERDNVLTVDFRREK